MRSLWRTLLVRAWAWAAAGVLLTAGSAPAFYFNGWPGSGQPVRRTLLPPSDQGQPGSPPGGQIPGGPGPTFPPQVVPPGVPGGQQPPPGGPHVPPGGPGPVPEPASGLLGVLGLTAVAAARRWRKK